MNNEILQKLKMVFPDAITEKQVLDEKTGKISFEYALKEEFIDTLKDNFNLANDNQAYGLNFPGKKLAKLVASEPSYKTLKLKSGDGVNEDTTQNVYIEGDNLEVLKVLKNAYQGQIKMIYIDPPYNTGSDGFVYNDDFSETQLEYWKKLGYINEEGAKLVKENSENLKGYKHSGWLTFMYPRLKLARDLLRDDGVIFISIDDNEVHNLRLICDEIFGADNFIGDFVVNSSPSAIDYGHIAKMHEYVLFYAKDINNVVTNQLRDEDKKFKYNDLLGGFNLYPLYNGNVAFNSTTRPNLFYPFYINPNNKFADGFFEISLTNHEGWIEVYPVISRKDGVQRVWRWGKQKSYSDLNKEIVGYMNEDGDFRIVQKTRHISKVIRSIQADKDISTRRGTSEVENILGVKAFSFPKPIELVRRLIEIGTDDGDIVLDFFSGSATTANAAMKLNAMYDIRCKYICVQIPELCDKDNETGKNAISLLEKLEKPVNICEIGKERIRRAGAKILSEWQAKQSLAPDDLLTVEVQSSGDNLPDVGFKVFSLVDSPLYQDNGNIDDDSFTQDKLDNLNVDYAFNDILYHYILRVGVTLDKVVTSYQRDNFNYAITERKLLLLDNNLTQAIAEQIVSQHRQEIDKLYYTVNSLDVFTSYTEIDGIAKRHNLPCEVL